jgi:hypothetical protein
MAAGDISSIKRLGRYVIPGSGQNTLGQPKNNKVITWGRITGLYTSGGLKLNDRGGIRALGVSVADVVHLEVRTAGTAGTPTNPTSDNLFLANLLETTNRIFVVDQVGQANPTVPEENDQMVIDYLVFGEDADTPELT